MWFNVPVFTMKEIQKQESSKIKIYNNWYGNPCLKLLKKLSIRRGGYEAQRLGKNVL